MDKSTEASISAGPNGDKFEYKVFDISFQYENNVINDGKTCTDYSKTDLTYEDCIVHHFGEYLKESYGCKFIPPWIDVDCTNTTDQSHTEKDLDPDLLDRAWVDIDKLIDGIHVETMKRCKPPCKRLVLLLIYLGPTFFLFAK